MALLTLADAKAQLNLTTTSDDVELEAYIAALTDVIENFIGPVETRTVTEMVDSRNIGLVLTKAPVVSVTSLTPVLTSGLALAVADVHVDPGPGVLRRRNGAMFHGGPWTAVYEAGRGAVPATINLAARILLQHLWSTQRGSRGPVLAGGDDMASAPVTGFGYAVPNRVLELLAPYRLAPVVA